MSLERNQNISQILYNNNTDSSGIDIDTYALSAVSQSIPVLCFISCLMFVGIIGNASVIGTYAKSFEKSTTNLFIFFLAVFDIINCLIVAKRIYDLLHPYTNIYHYLCSFMHFASYSADISAGIIIVCISFDRYSRIARPHRGWNVRQSKLAIVVIFVSSMTLSSMAFLVYGTEKVTPDSNKKNIHGYKCAIADANKQTVFPLLFSTLVLVCFGVGVIVLLIVYTLLGFKVRMWNEGRKNKQRGRIRSENTQVTSFSDETESFKGSQTEKQADEFKFNNVKFEPTDKDSAECLPLNRPVSAREISRSLDRMQLTPIDVIHSDGTKTLPHRKSHAVVNPEAIHIQRKSSIANFAGLRRGMKLSKTTTMFISATVAVVASHFPFICFKLFKTLRPNAVQNLTPVSSSIVMFAEYSYIISYAVNPIIYSFMNPKYRRECKTVLLNISKTIKCKTNQLNIRR